MNNHYRVFSGILRCALCWTAMLCAAPNLGNGQWIATHMNSDQQLSDLTARGPYLFAGTFGDGVHRTSDDNTWIGVNNGFARASQYIWIYHIAASEANLFASANDGVYRSSDDGQSWSLVHSGLTACLYATGQNVIAGSSGGIYLSTNSGTDWTYKPVPGISLVSVTSVLMNGSSIIVGTTSSGIFSSSDMGQNWTERNVGLPYRNGYPSISSILEWRGNIVVGAMDQGAIFISYGSTFVWTPLSAGITEYRCFIILTVDDILFAGTQSYGSHGAIQPQNGIFILTGTAATWASIGTLARPFTVLGLAVRNRNLYMAVQTSSESTGLAVWGVWKRPLSEIISPSYTGGDTPSQYRFFQNYPNPFNGSTTLEYDLPVGTSVLLQLYNVLGERVRTLVKDGQLAGHYSLTLDAAGLPSGLYLCRLTAGGSTQTLKLVLLR